MPVDDEFDETDESLSIKRRSDGLSVTGTSIPFIDDDDAPTGIALSVNPDTVVKDSQNRLTIGVTASIVGDSVYAEGRTIAVTVGNSSHADVRGSQVIVRTEVDAYVPRDILMGESATLTVAGAVRRYS